MFDLTGKIAVVTGASSGLGIQFAKALARQGADLAIAARRVDKLLAVKEEIESFGCKCIALKCDVTDENSVITCVKEIDKYYGHIDILVNNAGVSVFSPAEHMTLEQWDKVLNTDLRGIFLFSREVGKVMIKQQYGKIINISSAAGQRASMGTPISAYNAAKAGVINYTRALAAEWGQYNITVNCIGPGFFPVESALKSDLSEEVRESMLQNLPLHRFGADGEMDGTLVLFASDASKYITGQTLFVDGGVTAI